MRSVDALFPCLHNLLMLAETDVLDRLAAHAVAEKRIYYGVQWADYVQLVEELGDDRRVRLTFDHGVLEIMSPKRLHEQLTRLVDMVVALLAFELGLNLDNSGSMTMHIEQAARGGEPDSCFYIASEPAVRGVDEIDLSVHPPPDIVLEIDITSPSLDKFGLYAAAHVPEVWRYDGTRMQFHLLVEDSYQVVAHSRAFPHLSVLMLERYIARGRAEGSSAMLRDVKADIMRL